MPSFSAFRPNIAVVESPNCGADRMGMAVEGVVLHNTADPKESRVLIWFQDSQAKASAHFVIARNGHITQCVPLEEVAWHAGASKMLYRGAENPNVNLFTIGIELCNCGRLNKDPVSGRLYYVVAGKQFDYDGLPAVEAGLIFGNGQVVKGLWEPYAKPQLAMLKWLLEELQKEGYPVKNLVGHEEIAVPMGRKQDPGPLFPWEAFERDIPRKTQFQK
jgi:N-acetylmuramoyl-L-alanine amidase